MIIRDRKGTYVDMNSFARPFSLEDCCSGRNTAKAEQNEGRKRSRGIMKDGKGTESKMKEKTYKLR